MAGRLRAAMALLLFQALPRGLPASVEPAQVRGGHGVTGGGGLGAAVPRTVPPGEGQGAGSTGRGAREHRGAAPGGAGGLQGGSWGRGLGLLRGEQPARLLLCNPGVFLYPLHDIG